jgi:hypothetical protein
MDLPAEDTLRWIVRSYARFLAAHGKAIGRPELVLPTGDFFPDEFRGDAPGVARLLGRMIEYSPLADDLPLRIAFHQADAGAGGCSSPACDSRAAGSGLRGVDELPEGYQVHVEVSDVAHADVLTASLARSVGALVLHEGGDPLIAAGNSSEASEMAAVACGFGVLLANGAAVWAKSCGGLRMARATAMPVEEVAVALALFVDVTGVAHSLPSAHLGATQREAFDLALSWTDSNPSIVEALRDRPARLAEGHVEIEPVRGAVGRWLHKRKLDKELRAAPVAAAGPQRTVEQERRLAEARALVDEVLGGE